jgi:sulfide:quinone oxidoreductase
MFSTLARNTLKLAAGTTAVGTAYYVVYPWTRTQRKEKILVVGGGTAGVGVAAMLQQEGMRNVTIVEPSSVHYYQPLWTLVGGGAKKKEKSVKDMKAVLPSNTSWIKNAVKDIVPSENKVILADGTPLDYDYLVVAAGMQTDWDAIPGLVDGLKQKDSGVVTIYDFNYCEKTWETFQKLKNQAATYLFTFQPIIKCAGAPQKIMWLIDDNARKDGVRDKADITFCTPSPAMFGVKHYSEKLNAMRERKGVNALFNHKLISIDVANKTATFQDLENNQPVKKRYDFLHVAPMMSAPGFLKGSPISDKNGWVDVDKNTLQSKKYKNVFALGDCTNTPNSKTAAAITAQAPVVVHNLSRVIDGKEADGSYDGYASCPLIIARNKVLLAEFTYGGKLAETFSSDTGKWPFKYFGTDGEIQYRFFYFLKEQLFPFVYWNLWPRGLWYGTYGPLKPAVDGSSNSKGN